MVHLLVSELVDFKMHGATIKIINAVRCFASDPRSTYTKQKKKNKKNFFVALNCVTLLLFCPIENPIYKQQKPFTR